jgi:hypothetical protein
MVNHARFRSPDRPHLRSKRLVLLQSLLLEDKVRSGVFEERGEEVVVGVDGVAGKRGLKVRRDTHQAATESLFVALSL